VDAPLAVLAHLKLSVTEGARLLRRGQNPPHRRAIEQRHCPSHDDASRSSDRKTSVVVTGVPSFVAARIEISTVAAILLSWVQAAQERGHWALVLTRVIGPFYR
jgi:hypothetical protein